MATACWMHTSGPWDPLLHLDFPPDNRQSSPELPERIKKVAAYKDLVVPQAQMAAPPDEISGVFPLFQLTTCDSVKPCFPAIRKYHDGTVVEPRNLNAPYLTLDSITKVQGFMDHGFHSVHPLEPNLVACFGV